MTDRPGLLAMIAHMTVDRLRAMSGATTGAIHPSGRTSGPPIQQNMTATIVAMVRLQHTGVYHFSVGQQLHVLPAFCPEQVALETMPG